MHDSGAVGPHREEEEEFSKLALCKVVHQILLTVRSDCRDVVILPRVLSPQGGNAIPDKACDLRII